MPGTKGRIIAGKYRLVRRLGQGGMGAVWLARHHELDTAFAVKLMATSESSAMARARFKREAKAAAQLDSPHVVRTFDYGVDGEQPYIVMELLRGEDLRARLGRGPLSLGDTAEIVRQLCLALEAAHGLSLVHRDIKPRNVFLVGAADGVGHVKLLDFGIAKDLQGELVSEHTATGVVLGSPHYMSPEQARGGQVDGRSDLWSLAVLSYEMLTCRRAFDGVVLGDVIAKICAESPAPISQRAPELPAALEGWFERALRRDPAERFQTSTALYQALAAIAEADPDARSSLQPLPPASTSSRDGAAPPDRETVDAHGRTVPADHGEPFGRSASTLNVVATAEPAPQPPQRARGWLAAALLVTTLGLAAWASGVASTAGRITPRLDEAASALVPAMAAWQQGMALASASADAAAPTSSTAHAAAAPADAPPAGSIDSTMAADARAARPSAAAAPGIAAQPQAAGPRAARRLPSTPPVTAPPPAAPPPQPVAAPPPATPRSPPGGNPDAVFGVPLPEQGK